MDESTCWNIGFSDVPIFSSFSPIFFLTSSLHLPLNFCYCLQFNVAAASSSTDFSNDVHPLVMKVCRVFHCACNLGQQGRTRYVKQLFSGACNYSTTTSSALKWVYPICTQTFCNKKVMSFAIESGCTDRCFGHTQIQPSSGGFTAAWLSLMRRTLAFQPTRPTGVTFEAC